MGNGKNGVKNFYDSELVVSSGGDIVVNIISGPHEHHPKIRVRFRYDTRGFHGLLDRMLGVLIETNWRDVSRDDPNGAEIIKNQIIKILEEKFGCEVVVPK